MKRGTVPVHSWLVAGAGAVVMLLSRLSVGQAPSSTNAHTMKASEPSSVSTNEPPLKASEANPGPGPTTYEGSGAPPKVGTPAETVAGEVWGDYSYVIPFFEVMAFEAMLNAYDRTYLDEDIYGTSYKTFERNFKRTPVIDSDTFQINQLYHPYQGAMYFGFARSAGLSYWQSLLYSMGGSELWETAGEVDPPSFNDHVASGIGGSFLGEALFRMASLVLEGGGENPGFWQEVVAACISPPTGVNRLLFGERFDRIFPNHNPPTFTRLRLGLSTTVRESDSGPLDASYDRHQATADFLMAYGLPGKAGYTYDRPFDYFNFEFALGNGEGSFENAMIRGLLYGAGYEAGNAYRGLWGLYGSYDYISPQVFRVSSTALSVGTTAQWWLTPRVALQYSALGGLGYGAAGTIRGPGERNYRYGATPQGLLALRLIMGDRAMVDMTGREYFISDWNLSDSRSPAGDELIGRGNVGLTVRVYGQHAVGLQFTTTSRDAHSAGAEDRQQTEETIGLVYTLLGDDNFGAVEW